MKIMRLKELEGHDVYEFAYDSSYRGESHWHESSIYVSDEDFIFLSKYLDKVFSHYHYYGPQKVTMTEWAEIKDLVLKDGRKDSKIEEILDFIRAVDSWLESDWRKEKYFWILGI